MRSKSSPTKISSPLVSLKASTDSNSTGLKRCPWAWYQLTVLIGESKTSSRWTAYHHMAALFPLGEIFQFWVDPWVLFRDLYIFDIFNQVWFIAYLCTQLFSSIFWRLLTNLHKKTAKTSTFDPIKAFIPCLPSPSLRPIVDLTAK